MIFSFVFFCFSSFAGAWLTPQGETQFISKLNFESGNDFIDKDGKHVSVENFEKRSLDFYLEHGLSSKSNIGVKSEFVSLNQKNKKGADTLNTLGDSELWYKKHLHSSRHQVMTWQFSTLVPGFYNVEENILRPGDGQMHLEGRLLYGKAFQDWFLDLEVAYRERLGHAAGELRGDATIGKNFSPLLLYGQLFTIKSLGALQDSLYNSDSLRGSFNILLHQKWQISLYHDLYGKQRLLSTGVQLGYWRTFE